MTETLVPGLPVGDAPAPRPRPTSARGSGGASRRTRRRHAAERRFRLLGLGAVTVSAGILLLLLGAMLWRGASGFVETRVTVPISLHLDVTPARVAGPGGDLALAGAGLESEVDAAATATFGPGGADMLADDAWLRVRDAVRARPALLARPFAIPLPLASRLDIVAKRGGGLPADAAMVARLRAAGRLSYALDTGFLTDSDSTEAAGAGIWGALKGSLLTLLVTMGIAFPVGLCSALYLEEYAPRNRWTDLIEVSINNLAAVPSIVFGLLGLAVFLGTFHLPRSAPLVGGMTLALMTMPVIVIAARNALRGVPASVRDAALAVGASPVQVVFDHVLPLAMPGILTGAIIGLARALGETAPLLLIGMRAFIAAPPRGLADPATVLPVQIFLWSDEVDRAFVERTSAAILVLLALLLAMNALAIGLRNRFETRR